VGVGQAETEQKYVGVSGKRIRCFSHAMAEFQVENELKKKFT